MSCFLPRTFYSISSFALFNFPYVAALSALFSNSYCGIFMNYSAVWGCGIKADTFGKKRERVAKFTPDLNVFTGSRISRILITLSNEFMQNSHVAASRFPNDVHARFPDANVESFVLGFFFFFCFSLSI